MTSIIPLALFLILFWVVVPFASQQLRKRGWSENSRQTVCLSLYFGSIIVAMLVLHLV